MMRVATANTGFEPRDVGLYLKVGVGISGGQQSGGLLATRFFGLAAAAIVRPLHGMDRTGCVHRDMNCRSDSP